MTIGYILISALVCLICRCFIFYKRDEKWQKAFIPGYNKYIIGKISNNKKLGIVNAIMHPVLSLSFFFCFCFELWIIGNYSTSATVPTNTNDASMFQVMIPENIANIAIYSKYFLIAMALITIVAWSMMMWKFTLLNKRSPWFIILWVFVPAIPYMIFAISNTVCIENKIYIMKRVEKT